MKRIFSTSKLFRLITGFVSTGLLALASLPLNAQTAPPAAAAMPSPPASANVTVAGGTIDIHYNTPHLRGRHVGGPEIVPYGKVWRTGANPATTLITSAPLVFGTLLVPAGTHTIYSLPTADSWQLIINKATGQWGLTYDAAQDLGRVKMTMSKPPAPIEVYKMTLSATGAKSAKLQMEWEQHIASVAITVK